MGDYDGSQFNEPIDKRLREADGMRTFGSVESKGRPIMITLIGLGFLMVVIGAVKAWWVLSD